MGYKAKKNGHKNKPRKLSIGRILLLVVITFLIFVVGRSVIGNLIPTWKVDKLGKTSAPDWINVQIINVDGDSRRGERLEGINDIVIHYVGNPGSTAQQNHDYYTKPESEVSSHFVVGLEGEIIQCIPLNEKSSASNGRNNDTISIEVCHPDKSGKFTEASYNSLVKLTAWLSQRTNLDENHIIRHYDITGKKCPLYFVQHEDEWERFKADVTKRRLKSNEYKK